MVGFVLKNTLSNNGGVTRGICKVDKTDMLTNIVETHNIVKTDKGAAIEGENGLTPIDVEEKVSMNMWGFLPDFFTVLEKEFKNFLESLQCNDLSLSLIHIWKKNHGEQRCHVTKVVMRCTILFH